jgi:hypothetical protein
MKQADNFNPGKWLVENKLTNQSKLNENIQPTRGEFWEAKGKNIILPGYYYVTIGDMEGRYFSKLFPIKVTKEISYDDAFEQLKKRGYSSPWNYLTIELLKDDEIKNTEVKYTLPDQQTTLF